MNIQLFQLITIALFIALAYGAYKVKIRSIKIALIAMMLILFFANPLRFKQENMSSVERFKAEDNGIPERVIVEDKKFTETQKEAYESLKNESKELVNETIN